MEEQCSVSGGKSKGFVGDVGSMDFPLRDDVPDEIQA
jgi:hypothetical protein